MLKNMTGSDDFDIPIERFCNKFMKENGKAYTSQGLLFLNEWGPNRYAANIAFVCGIAADSGYPYIFFMFYR